MRIVWLAEARRNRADQIAYIAERNPAAAMRIGDALLSATAQLEHQPMLGRVGRVGGIRELVVGRTPLLVIYRVQSDQVQIIRILHGSQRWPPLG